MNCHNILIKVTHRLPVCMWTAPYPSSGTPLVQYYFDRRKSCPDFLSEKKSMAAKKLFE